MAASKALSSSLTLEPFPDLLLPLGIARVHILVCLRKRGGNISVDLSLFVLFYKNNFINQFNDFFKTKNKTKNY